MCWRLFMAWSACSGEAVTFPVLLGGWWAWASALKPRAGGAQLPLLWVQFLGPRSRSAVERTGTQPGFASKVLVSLGVQFLAPSRGSCTHCLLWEATCVSSMPSDGSLGAHIPSPQAHLVLLP